METKNKELNRVKQESKKAGAGRPTKKNLIHWNIVKLMYERGFTDEQVCKAVGIDRSNLTRWKQKNKEFRTTIKDWNGYSILIKMNVFKAKKKEKKK